MRPIHINHKTARTSFQAQLPENTKAADVTIEITRTGNPNGWRVIYPALDYTDGKLTFAWDDVLWNAKSGRYQGIIRVNGHPSCHPCIALHIGCPCTMGQSANEYFTHQECKDCNND